VAKFQRQSLLVKCLMGKCQIKNPGNKFPHFFHAFVCSEMKKNKSLLRTDLKMSLKFYGK